MRFVLLLLAALLGSPYAHAKKADDIEALVKILSLSREAKEREEKRLAAIKVPACAAAIPRRVAGDWSLMTNGAEREISLDSTIAGPELIPAALDFLMASETGAKYVTELLPKLASRDIEIKLVTRDELDATEGVPPRSVAAFQYRDKKKTLYLVRDSELGLASVHLFHEMIHALDEEFLSACDNVEPIRAQLIERSKELLAKVSRQKGTLFRNLHDSDFSPAEIAEIQELNESHDRLEHVCKLATERKAYPLQTKLIQELRKRFPCVGPYMDTQAMRKKVQITTPNDKALIRAYELNPLYVNPQNHTPKNNK